ncbi:hypothetical protein CRG98_011865 [Punica granatum]|uniref:Fe2OG dioxygenase domain-containing protein n=1 Tax=Punica granatum TaxID=22663 RepID=A0A2I0KGL9_PUNGR|nr:hypothetical protein CRG98_011865 [Punica granatum]
MVKLCSAPWNSRCPPTRIYVYDMIRYGPCTRTLMDLGTISALKGLHIPSKFIPTSTMTTTEAYDPCFEPPFELIISTLLQNHSPEIDNNHKLSPTNQTLMYEKQDYNCKFTVLPLVDISHLGLEEGHPMREECEREIAWAAKDWGFFQIVNHGIPRQVLEQMKGEQEKVFRQPFCVKRAGGGKLLNLGEECYRWGNPTATCLRQMSWSEAFHIPINDISRIEDESLRSAIEIFAAVATNLAEKIVEVLAANLRAEGTDYFRVNCTRDSCYLRMNRYPPCPNFSSEVFGLMPHTDSDFLAIVCQDSVGGLQLMKDDGTWASVSPNPNALVINVGDLLQAWSNGVYKSVKHRVMASAKEERHSMAFFYCPKSNTVIKSCINPSIYRNFSFLEYRLQVQKDVKATGDKVHKFFL